MFTRHHLESLPRKELQVLAKENGVKANGSSDSIISNLLDVVGSEVEDVAAAPVEAVNVPEESAEMPTPAALERGSVVFGWVADEWVEVTIKKVNKKSFRVVLSDNSEVTLDMELVQAEKPAVEAAMEVEPDAEATMEEVGSTEVTVEEETAVVSPVVDAEVAVRHPKVEWSMTKAQKLRNEAISKNIAAASASKEPAPRPSSFSQSYTVTTPSKRKLFKGVDRNSFLMETCTPFAAKSRRNSVQEQAAPPPAPVQKVGTPKAPPKSPNFKAIHAKQFQNSKPITAMVAKSAAVEDKMTAALARAQSDKAAAAPAAKAVVAPSKAAVPVKTAKVVVSAAKPTAIVRSAAVPAPVAVAKKGVVMGARPRAATTIVRKGENVYGTNSFGSGSIEQKTFGVHANVGPVAKAPPSVTVPVFKARPMPNFKKVHSKLPVTPTSAAVSSINKENSANRRPSTVAVVPTTAKAAATSDVAEKSRMHRQSLYMSSAKDKRASMMGSKRAFSGY